MDVGGAVETQGLEVERLEHVQGLEHDRALDPARELVDVDAFIRGRHGLFETDLPAGQVLHGDEPALLLRAADEFAGDVALIKAIVGGPDGLPPRLPRGQGLTLGFDELFQRFGEIGLAEDLARPGGLVRLSGMREQNGAGVGPGLDPVLVLLDAVARLLVHGIAFGHADGRRQDLGQAHRPEFGEHRQEPARRAGRHRGQDAVFGGIGITLALVEFGRRSGRRDAQGVQADDLAGLGIVDEGLGLAAPAQDVVHGADGPEHGAGRVDGVPALGEDHGPGRGRQRLPGDGHPFPAVEDRLLRPLSGRPAGRHRATPNEDRQEYRFHRSILSRSARRPPYRPVRSRSQNTLRDMPLPVQASVGTRRRRRSWLRTTRRATRWPTTAPTATSEAQWRSRATLDSPTPAASV